MFLQRIVDTCKQTFSKPKGTPVPLRLSNWKKTVHTNYDLNELISQLKKLNLKEFGSNNKTPLYKKDLVLPESLSSLTSYKDTYISEISTCATLYHDSLFHLAIFYLPKGTLMPLHDHPNMCVITKVLHGMINISSYSPSEQNNNFVQKNEDITLTTQENNDIYVLGPIDGNMHQIKALDDTVMFDVLSPPYDETVGRTCNYYKATKTKDENIYKLTPYEPDDFVCLEVKYKGERLR